MANEAAMHLHSMALVWSQYTLVRVQVPPFLRAFLYAAAHGTWKQYNYILDYYIILWIILCQIIFFYLADLSSLSGFDCCHAEWGKKDNGLHDFHIKLHNSLVKAICEKTDKN